MPLGALSDHVAPVPLLQPSRIKIGRSMGNDLVLEEVSVSRNHATISINKRGVIKLVDQGSFNGTLVRGRRIAKKIPCQVIDGDILHFGTVMFRLLFVKRSASSPQQPVQEQQEEVQNGRGARTRSLTAEENVTF